VTRSSNTPQIDRPPVSGFIVAKPNASHLTFLLAMPNGFAQRFVSLAGHGALISGLVDANVRVAAVSSIKSYGIPKRIVEPKTASAWQVRPACRAPSGVSTQGAGDRRQTASKRFSSARIAFSIVARLARSSDRLAHFSDRAVETSGGGMVRSARGASHAASRAHDLAQDVAAASFDGITPSPIKNVSNQVIANDARAVSTLVAHVAAVLCPLISPTAS